MSCFDLVHNIKRLVYAAFGKNLCSLEDFYTLTLKKRNFINKIKHLSPQERIVLILHQDKEIFEAWKENKNLSYINNILCAIIVVWFIMVVGKHS